ncbi:HxsD-like protein [Candidatus Pacearchaeota archaeon]|nr:HxsD-like protein [Candidatus Pacearchaeota archaeon]
MESFETFLNLKFYNIDSIEESIEDFGEVCDIFFDKCSGEIKVISFDAETSSEEIFREFCNYVLGVMKNNQVI